MSLVLDLAAFGVILAVGRLLETSAGLGDARRALPGGLQTVVGAVAIGGAWMLPVQNLVPNPVVDASVVTVAIGVGLWLGLPVVLVQFVDADWPANDASDGQPSESGPPPAECGVVDVGAHLRATAESDAEDAPAPGVYRVVGATDDRATLLRVTDADSRRVHSGDLVQVSGDALEHAFEPAENPDAGFSPVETIRNQLSGLYWQFRKFL